PPVTEGGHSVDIPDKMQDLHRFRKLNRCMENDISQNPRPVSQGAGRELFWGLGSCTLGLYTMANQALIHSLPKAELHLHLEGSVEPATLLELSRRHDPVPLTASQIEELYRYSDFHGFLMAFKAVTERLQTPADFELITHELMRKLRSQNVLHAEVYLSVGVIFWREGNFDSIFEGIQRGR